MTFSFDALSRSDAETITCWQYEGEYSIYDIAVDQRASITEYMLDAKNQFFSVYRNDELIGFCSLGKDGQVRGGSYDESALDIGAGMRPELVGRGEGIAFLESVVRFAESKSGGLNLRATIAAWNRRAIRTSLAVGFSHRSTFSDNNGRQFAILVRHFHE